MSYWLHRISNEREVSLPLFDKGFLSIGWQCFTPSDILTRIENEGIDGFSRFMSEHKKTERGRWGLWHFSRFRIGDIVVVPLYGREFSICKVTGKPFSASAAHGITLQNLDGQSISLGEKGFLCPGKTEYYDIGFLVSIEELKRMPRSHAAADLVSRMKMRQTNANINDLANSVQEALSALGPISLHDAIQDAAAENIHSVVKKHLTPDKLECVVSWYMKKKGANRTYIPAKNERGKENGADADVIAEFDDLGVIFYIQVKKHEGETDEWAIQQISEYQRQKQNDGDGYTCISWAVSTAEFSEKAILKAGEAGVRLVGGNDLMKMFMDCGISDIDSSLSD